MDLIAKLPWWAGVALAFVSYLLLHKLSVPPSPSGLQPGQAGSFVKKAMLAGFAFYGQFVIPPLCLLGALGSFLRRRKRESLLSAATLSKSADLLNGMSWQEV